MSRLSDLLRQVERSDAQLAADLRAEVKALESRRSFGLNFERHVPESVDLPGRPVRRGDKVRVLPERGSAAKVDPRLWFVGRVADGTATLLSVSPLVEPVETSASVSDLVVVAEFRDPIYPGLVSTGRVERGGPEKPFHTVINAENHHALQALLYTHEGKVDAIYIDPPYNTGAKDWKYNNDYVDGEDAYRHSKWLAFMERRLKLAKRLLNPDNSVLIVTIDEKEYLRLGLLLQQVFPEGRVQMVSSVINATGVIRTTEFTRTNEFVFFAQFGESQISPEVSSGAGEELPWNLLQRREMSSRRHGPQSRPDQFYPIYVGAESGQIEAVGESIPTSIDRNSVVGPSGCVAVWPLKPDGTEMVWGLTPASLRRLLDQGFVKLGRSQRGAVDRVAISYLTSGKVRAIETGTAQVVGRRPDGSAVVASVSGHTSMPTTAWSREGHNAQSHGTKLISRLLPERRFPFPKALYAVEDALRFFVSDKPNAVVLDFFAGSGTTAHAVMRLNKQDDGRRQCISVTNNEVSAEEQKRLRGEGLRPGDAEWEQWGICDYIAKPRIQAAITGLTPDGDPIKGDYKFTDEFPMADGFEENVEFFTMTYEMPRAIEHGRNFSQIAPLLWLKAGARGRRVDVPTDTFDVAEAYGVLFNVDAISNFLSALVAAPEARMVFIVTDDERAFQMVCADLPDEVEPVRLYASYLSNFEIGGRSR